MAIDDLLKDVKRLVNVAVLYAAASVFAAGCGAGSDSKGEMLEDVCTNNSSPLCDKHLWSIAGCEVGLYFDPSGKIHPFDEKVGKYIDGVFKGYLMSYDGLRVFIKSGEDTTRPVRVLVMNPNPIVREDSPSDGNFIRAVQNHMSMLQSHGQGYFLLPEGGVLEEIDDNAYMALDIPFPGKQECKKSIYFINWEDWE